MYKRIADGLNYVDDKVLDPGTLPEYVRDERLSIAFSLIEPNFHAMSLCASDTLSQVDRMLDSANALPMAHAPAAADQLDAGAAAMLTDSGSCMI